MNLTKSDFLKYQVCPSYFWLWRFKNEVVPKDDEDEIKRRLEQGNEVEEYARQLFPDGELVNGFGKGAQAETELLIQSSASVIFQATVVTDSGLLAMADIIERVDGGWYLYEVKSTNSIKPEHLMDVAFQRAAFEEAGYTIVGTGVIHTNKEYVKYGSAIDSSKLLIKQDISEKVEEVLPTIKQQINDALTLMDKTNEPKGCSCRLKSRSGHCPTFNILNPDVPEYSVFNISRIRGKKLEQLVDNDILEIKDVPDDMELSPVQANQVATAKTGRPIIDKDKIKQELDELAFPLYFLDYETISTAIPIFKNTIPFQQVPFQLSLHILDSPDSELRHVEYLAKDTDQQNLETFARTLKEAIEPKGSVIVWNKSFEIGRNAELGKMLPEYGAFFEDINNRVFDLMEIFSKQLYVHPDFKGSSSVKAVLPVLVPELSYKELDIHNGALASVKWYEAVIGEAEDPEKIFSDLLKYCKLDTLAMVKIYLALLGEIDGVYHYKDTPSLLTKNEQSLFARLEKEFGDDYLVVPQEHISSLVDSRVKGQWSQAAFKHVNSWSIDFVLCSKDKAKPLVAIELDDDSHERIDRIKRDVEVERIFREIDLPLLRLRLSELPASYPHFVEEIHSLLGA